MSLSIENGDGGPNVDGFTTPPPSAKDGSSAPPRTPPAPKKGTNVMHELKAAIEPLVEFVDDKLKRTPMCREAANVDVFDAQIVDLYRVYRTDIDCIIDKAFAEKEYLLNEENVNALNGEHVHAKRMIELYQMSEIEKEALFEKNLVTCREHETAEGVKALFEGTGSP